MVLEVSRLDLLIFDSVFIRFCDHYGFVSFLAFTHFMQSLSNHSLFGVSSSGIYFSFMDTLIFCVTLKDV